MTEIIKREKHGIEYVLLSDLEPEQLVSFRAFLFGAQIPLFEGEGAVAYYYDYAVWRNQLSSGT